jgi:subtilisin-like proprotein convertase family protein/WD40 repeat protein
VLAPRATGKSSLMGRSVRTLRRSGELAAIVDLAQLDARGDSADPDRWLRSIAHRIAHELRLPVDIEQWWREKRALGEQRLDDFFWEIVLTNTTAPITVFFDEIERALDLPFGPKELFATIRACYTRRRSEPDYSRLSFVVLGVATARTLCPDERLSPFVDGVAIPLTDFDVEQSYQLAPGLGGDPALAQALMDRIFVWTSGHPYLTQKVARAVARKGGRLEDVERAVRELLLEAAHEDPLLSHIHATLAARSPAARRALVWLDRLAKKGSARAEPGSAALELLELAGVLVVDPAGTVRYRNRMLAEAFGRRWLKAHRPKRWRIAAGIAAASIAAAAGAYWYQHYLPRPYLRALAAEQTDVAALAAAHARLRELPGFGAAADELLTAALERRSADAADFAAASAVDHLLRSALGDAERADRLMDEFWMREAVNALHRERRDDALLYALEAQPAEAARSLLAELIGPDYTLLTSVREWAERPPTFAADWSARRLVGLDADLVPRVFALDAGAVANAAVAPFTVLEHRPLERTLEVEESGSAGAFTLTMLLDHPARDELAMTLIAPSGAESGVLALPDGDGEQAFVAAPDSPLGALADENREGVWRLTVIDRSSEHSGSLVSWALAFGADAVPWRDVPVGGAAIPDAVRTPAGHVTLGPNGRVALARPAAPGPVGTLALWSLRDASRLRDLTLPAPPAAVEFAANGARLAAAAGNTVSVWSTTEDSAPARITTQTRFVLPPALSTDGDYLMIAEAVEGSPPLFSLLRAADGALLASVEGVEGAAGWLLGPEARYLVLLGAGPGAIGVLDPRRGGEPRTLPHPRPVERVMLLRSGTALVTVDAAGDVRLWQIGGPAGGTFRYVGTTVDAASLSAADDGTRIAYAARGSTVQIRDGTTGEHLQTLRLTAARPLAITALAPDGRTLVTIAGTEARTWQLGAGAPRQPVRPAAEVTARALDAQAERAALGFRAGYVRIVPAAALEASVVDQTLDYFGHRGAVQSLALDAAHAVAASGGARDGTVRIWSTDTGEPGHTLAHGMSAVDAVALSRAGELVASATSESIKVWQLADGSERAEQPTPLAPTTALAFSADDRLLGIGDALGGFRLLASSDATPASARFELGAAPAWVGAGADATQWLVASDHWLHVLEVRAGDGKVLRSRLLPPGFEPAARVSDHAIRGFGGPSGMQIETLELDADPPLDPQAPELARDWNAVLGRRIAADGSIEPIIR